MTSQQLLTKFSQGINWNAFLYFTYKVSATLTGFLLYAYMDSGTFSAYSNLNSSMFLLLLWLDFGFNKAIARFCPEYAKNGIALKKFLRNILLFKVLSLMSAIPLYLMAIKYVAMNLQLQAHLSYFYWGAVLLLTQGMVNVIRLIYHAYFRQKQFNLMQAITLLLQVGSIALAGLIVKDQNMLLCVLLGVKITTSCLLLLLSSTQLPYIFNQVVSDAHHEHINIPKTNREFIVHSGAMWFNTNIKSLTERNFLVPLFTYIFGPATANMFKVANDGALLFYRIVLKTIGTSDTALFAHLLTMRSGKPIWQVAFNNLTTKLAALCIPLSGIIFILYVYEAQFAYDQFVFQAFLLISICFLIEAIFSPYERILEVHRSYRWLLCAYTPYIIMVITLLTTPVMTSIGLFNSILLIHGVRLVSSFIMLVITRIQYGLFFPIRFVCSLSLYTCIAVCLLTQFLKSLLVFFEAPTFK